MVNNDKALLKKSGYYIGNCTNLFHICMGSFKFIGASDIPKKILKFAHLFQADGLQQVAFSELFCLFLS